jgi:hypothetical protein
MERNDRTREFFPAKENLTRGEVMQVSKKWFLMAVAHCKEGK